LSALACYEHLPIDQAAMDLTVALERMVAGFSRHRKYTQGTELRLASQPGFASGATCQPCA